jgi:hypothetical protein
MSILRIDDSTVINATMGDYWRDENTGTWTFSQDYETS